MTIQCQIYKNRITGTFSHVFINVNLHCSPVPEERGKINWDIPTHQSKQNAQSSRKEKNSKRLNEISEKHKRF